MKIYNSLKKVCVQHNLEIIDINEYETQPNFKEKYDELTKGRKVALSFVSNKITNKIKRVKENE